jgi:hypothetical protein
MPPRHRKGIADAVNPPEPDDSSKQIAEKDLLHRAAYPLCEASARRHLGGLVTSGQLCPDLPAGYVITGLLYRPRAGSAVSEIFQWFPLPGGVDGRSAVAPCCPPYGSQREWLPTVAFASGVAMVGALRSAPGSWRRSGSARGWRHSWAGSRLTWATSLSQP